MDWEKLKALLIKLGLKEDQLGDVKDGVDEMLTTAATTAGTETSKTLRAKITALEKQIKEAAPQDVTALQDKLDALTAERDTAVATLKTTTRDLAKAVKVGETVTSQFHGTLIDNEVSKHLTAANVAPKLMPGAMAMLRGQAAVKVDGEKRGVMFGEKDAATFIKEWAGGEEGKPFVAAPNSGGGNGNGNGLPLIVAGKSITRAAFNALPPEAAMAHIKEKGVVVDA